MTDNVNIFPSDNINSVSVATDDIGGVHYPIYKTAFGADGSQTPVSLANPMPIGFPTDGPNFDAFARLRVSNPDTIFDSKQIHNTGALFWDEEAGGTGTSSGYGANSASTVLLVSASTAGDIVRQTFMRFNYQPGKSQLIFMTGTLDSDGAGGGAGLERGWGYGDEKNGIFLVQDGSNGVGLIRRTYTSGSAIDNVEYQADWSLDVMDGSGRSGITLDWKKSQILIIDFEWLGVGRVRCGFVVDGGIYYVHEFSHANRASGVYMSTPNLPLRYWISNSGSYGNLAYLEQICSSVISEGGTNDLGVLRYKSTEGTHVDVAIENTIYAILGIRLKSANIDATVKLVTVAIAEHVGSKSAEWVAMFNPTVTGTVNWSDESNSVVQTSVVSGSPTLSGGTTIGGGFFASANKGGAEVSDIDNALRLGASIAGTSDEIYIGVRPIGGSSNIDIEASITWRELS